MRRGAARFGRGGAAGAARDLLLRTCRHRPALPRDAGRPDLRALPVSASGACRRPLACHARGCTPPGAARLGTARPRRRSPRAAPLASNAVHQHAKACTALGLLKGAVSSLTPALLHTPHSKQTAAGQYDRACTAVGLLTDAILAATVASRQQHACQDPSKTGYGNQTEPFARVKGAPAGRSVQGLHAAARATTAHALTHADAKPITHESAHSAPPQPLISNPHRRPARAPRRQPAAAR